MDDSVVVASATTADGDCQIIASTVVCQLARIEPEATATITMVVYPKRTGALHNTASVDSPGQAAVIATPVAGATVTVAGVVPAALSIRKSVDVKRTRAGGTARFTIAVRNTGATMAVGVRVCDPLPPGLTYQKAPGATIRGGRACWSIPLLPGGGRRTLRLTARATGDQRPRTVKNTASAAAANAARQRSSASVQVGASLARAGGVTG